MNALRAHPIEIRRLRASVIVAAAVALGAQPAFAAAPTGALENPTISSFQSGIGLVSGWVCGATKVTYRVNGGVERDAAYGTSRQDTQSICGDVNNGFGALFNWNLLGDGTHSIRVLADGVEFGEASFNVATLGTAFLRDASGQFILQDFPSPGDATLLRWQESSQNFVIAGANVRSSIADSNLDRASSLNVRGVLENPTAASFQSGIGVVSGWVCDAESITVRINGGVPLAAAYGTSRTDTVATCGDSNNGFGLLLNWNLLGNGTHHVAAFADGVQFAQGSFNVSTLGVVFLRDVEGKYKLPNFPAAGQGTIVEWSTAVQNFRISGRTFPEPVCGDGVREGAEECDGDDFIEGTCSDWDATFIGGQLRCNLNCRINLSGCVRNICGDGIVQEPYEQCEPGGAALCEQICGPGNCLGYSCTNGCQTETFNCRFVRR